MNPISTASAGLISAAKLYDQASQAVVQATAPNSQTDPAGAIVSQIAAKTQLQASAKMVQASDQMFQSTLDILV